jgi:hypothetical protein
MNEELQALQTKVNAVMYNPFISLKDLAKSIKNLLLDKGNYPEAIVKLDAAISSLDQLEGMDHHNIERIKGFNKAKSNILKVTKDLLSIQQ